MSTEEGRTVREVLKSELLGFIANREASTAASDEASFDALADRVVAFQSSAVPAYGRLVHNRSWESGWRSAPLVPTAVFRELDLTASMFDGADDAAVFHSSGTTAAGGGPGARGRRRVPDLELYHAAMQAPFVRYVLAGDSQPRPWWTLIPSAAALPDSSLSHMTSALAQNLATTTTSTRPTDATGPVLVMTTAFAIVQHLDSVADKGLPPLPPGSRMMLTGGFKGRSRVLDESSLLEAIEDALGIAPADVIAEYGMTELTSQAYGKPFEAPPWLVLRVVDPATNEDLPVGAEGLVAFLDLLNLDNVSAIVTSDLGRLDENGRLTLLGRAPGAILRGCSLTAEDLGIH